MAWFSTRDLKEFTAEAVGDFAAAYGPEQAAAPEDKGKASKKRRKAVETLLRRVTEFQRSNGLWLYRKARLCKLIQEDLERRGYPEEFIEQVANDLVFRVTAGVRRPI